MSAVFCGLLAVLCLLLAGPARSGAVDVAEGAERIPVGWALEYFLDESGGLDVAAAVRDARYRPLAGNTLSLGFRSAALWARLTLRHTGGAPIERWLQVGPERLEEVSLFLPEPSGGFRRLDNGLKVAVRRRPIPARGIVFPLRLEAGQTLTVYLRVQSRTALSLNPVLWTPDGFRDAAHREDLFAMLNIGALLGLATYSLLLFPLQRDRAALLNGFSLVCFCLIETAYYGYGYAYLWPDSPDWAARAPPVFVMLNLLCLNRFAHEFLALRQHRRPLLDVWLSGLALAVLGMAAAYVLGAPIRTFGPIALALVLVSLISLLSVSLYAWRAGYRPARYLVFGLILVLVNAVARLGEIQGWLPFLSGLSGQAGLAGVSFASNSLYFIGIGVRANWLRREKERAQILALKLQEEVQAHLEAQVAERTFDLREAKERAERADRAKGEFLARVSHELRTPLHAILGYTHLLRRDPAGIKTGERLALVEGGGRHLLGLIDDLLDYARWERNALAPVPEAAFLYRLLERCREHGAVLAAKRRNRFEAVFGESLPAVVRVDARRLEQVLLILLSNAARYTQGGAIRLAVRAEESAMGKARLRFAVADTGIGIAEADLERIFQPFERALGEERSNGLGLGLAIGRQIVRAMGGELQVESRLGAGSRFRFTVELEPAAEDEIPIEMPDLDILGYAGPPRGILVVEDHAASRCFLEQLLSELGFEVHSADCVREALELMASAPFDLAVLDQWLPDGSAWDLLRALRRNTSTAEIPAILLSAMPPTPPDGWSIARGFDAVLLKPASGAELLDLIGGLLGLDWVRKEADSAGEATAIEQADSPETRRDPAPPGVWSATEQAELVELAQQGAVYEIEEWIARTRRARPDGEPWLADIEARLAALDFEGIAAVFPSG
jgi:signal transduction histidine kinase/DNA-binding NarL/FixJ family response regulator